MITNIKSSLIALLAFVLCGIASARAAVGPGEKEMKEAIVKLEMAKYSRASGESLATARQLLDKAKNKKAAVGDDAFKQVDKAMEASRKNSRKAMQSHIASAVRSIRKTLQVSGS